MSDIIEKENDNANALDLSKSNEMEIALRDEIKVGSAKVICTLENNVRKEYNIEIQKVYKSNFYK